MRSPDLDTQRGTPEDSETAPGVARRQARLGVPAATLALVVTVIGAAVSADRVVSWTRARTTEHAATSARDAALSAGLAGITTFNTVDYVHASATVDAWRGCSTGVLRESVTTTRARAVAQMRRRHASTTATVVAGALSSYDAKQGAAAVVAVVSVTGSNETFAKKRFVAQLKDVRGTWLLAGLAPMGSAS